MKNLSKVFALPTLLVAAILSLVSCDVDTDPVPFNAGMDVVVQDIKTDTGIKYSIVVYASANNEIKSAKATAPGTGGKVYQLTAASNNLQFVYKPQTSDYTTEMPAAGDYTFEIISMTDEKITGKDVLGAEKLAPIVIKTVTMTSHLLKTTWDKLPAADAYVVRLYSANKAEMLFASNLLIDKSEYEFGANTSGWAYGKSPSINTDYVVELVGVKVETGATVDKWSNLQFLTLDSKTIKWE